MIKKLLVGILAVAVLFVGYVAFKGNDEVAPVVVPAGALSSPDIASPYLSFGGVRRWAYTQDMRQASSTLCSIQAPAASSTLVSLTALFSTTAAIGATQYAFGNDPTAFSTTTIIVAPYAAAAGAKLEIVASTTMNTAFVLNGVVPPSTYINLKLSTSTAGVGTGFAPVGWCKAVFQEV